MSICFQSLMPYAVATARSNTCPVWGVIPSAKVYAKCALLTVGLQKRTYGCIPHAIQLIDL